MTIAGAHILAAMAILMLTLTLL